MKKTFESCGHSFDAEFFPAESSCMIRFYDSKNEDFGGSLHDLVIAEPSYGFLLVQYTGRRAATGFPESHIIWQSPTAAMPSQR